MAMTGAAPDSVALSFEIAGLDEPKSFVLVRGLREALSIGRDSKCDIRVPLLNASWKHAEVRLPALDPSNDSASLLVLCDLSSNGTVLKSSDGVYRRVTNGVEIPIHDGDIVILPIKVRIPKGTKPKDLDLDSTRMVMMLRLGVSDPSLSFDPAAELRAASEALGTNGGNLVETGGRKRETKSEKLPEEPQPQPPEEAKVEAVPRPELPAIPIETKTPYQPPPEEPQASPSEEKPVRQAEALAANEAEGEDEDEEELKEQPKKRRRKDKDKDRDREGKRRRNRKQDAESAGPEGAEEKAEERNRKKSEREGSRSRSRARRRRRRKDGQLEEEGDKAPQSNGATVTEAAPPTVAAPPAAVPEAPPEPPAAEGPRETISFKLKPGPAAKGPVKDLESLAEDYEFVGGPEDEKEEPAPAAKAPEGEPAGDAEAPWRQGRGRKARAVAPTWIETVPAASTIIRPPAPAQPSSTGTPPPWRVAAAPLASAGAPAMWAPQLLEFANGPPPGAPGWPPPQVFLAPPPGAWS